MKKLIDFKDKKFEKLIQNHADDCCEGNFSMAVRQLIVKGLEDQMCLKSVMSNLPPAAIKLIDAEIKKNGTPK